MSRLRLTLIFVALMSFGAAGIGQESALTRDLDRQIEEAEALLAEQAQESRQLSQALGETLARLESRLAERDAVSERLAELRQARSALLADIERLSAQIEATEAEVTELSDRLTRLETDLGALLVNLYKQRASRSVGLLAKSETFHELQVKNYFLSLIASQDVRLIEEVNRTIAELARAQAELSEQVLALQNRDRELASNEAEQEAAREQLDALIEDLESSREGQQAQRLDSLRAQERLESSLSRAIQARRAEEDRLIREAEEKRRLAEEAVGAGNRARLENEAEALESRAASLRLPARPAEDGLVLPFESPQLVSRYGDEGPYITLRAQNPGNAVRAVMSGLVTEVQPVSANSGYVVVIAHATDLWSAYLNLQRPEVRVGEQVQQGQRIGFLGGGSLIAPDTLVFRMGTPGARGVVWIDPSPKLGF